MNLPGLRGIDLGTLSKRVVGEFLRDDMLTYAAAVSYHLFLALFPFVVFLLALLSFFNLSPLFDEMLAQARRALPNEAMQQVEQVIGEVVGQRQGGLLSFGILVSIWVASAGMRAVMNALNQAYDIEEGRARWKRYTYSLGFTIAFAVLVVLATALMVVGPSIAASLAGVVGLGGEVLTVWRWIRIPAALLLAMVAASLVYYFAPNVEQRFRLATPGSVFAVLLWALVSVAFQLYVTHFGRYSVVYGSIGAVIVLLLYFFLSASVLLLGGEINAEVQRMAPRPDDPRPRPAEEGAGGPRPHRTPAD